MTSSLPKDVQKSTLCLIFAEMVVILMYILFVEYDTEATYAADVTGANQVTKYYPMFQDVHVMIFVGFGFLMTFMKKYSFSSVTFNFVLAAVAIQYGILVTQFFGKVFHTEKAGEPSVWDQKIRLSIKNLIQGDFAAGAVLISFGAVLGKASLEQLCTMLGLELIFYALNEAIGVEKLHAVDMGGSMFVHTFGAYFGLACSFQLTRKNLLTEAGSRFGSTYTSDIFAMIGTLFLWMFWPSFNGAMAEGAQQHRVVINTVLALTNSCVAAVLMSRILQPEHKLSMVDIQNATLAGGVAVGSSADLVIEPFGALIIGFVAGSLSVYGYVKITPWLEKKLSLHDSCGVHNLHGMPGILGGIAGCISAMSANNSRYKDELANIFSAIGDENRSITEQGWYQLAALFVTLLISITGGLITGAVMNWQQDRSIGVKNYGSDDENWILEDEDEEAVAVELADMTKVNLQKIAGKGPDAVDPECKVDPSDVAVRIVGSGDNEL